MYLITLDRFMKCVDIVLTAPQEDEEENMKFGAKEKHDKIVKDK
jgi:hypothetical protein